MAKQRMDVSWRREFRRKTMPRDTRYVTREVPGKSQQDLDRLRMAEARQELEEEARVS